MNEVIWGEPDQFDATGSRLHGITQTEYIVVRVQYYPKDGSCEYEASIWASGHSTGNPPTHSIVGRGGHDKGKQAVERLLQEGLDRF